MGACLMTHPTENKPMLLCGQQFGYVTAYDLPEFRPRGSWVCKQGSEIRSMLDCQFNGLFLTGGAHSDVMMWKWTGQPQGAAPRGRAGGGAAVAANPFAGGGAAAPVASSPFAPSGGCPGGGMMM